MEQAYVEGEEKGLFEEDEVVMEELLKINTACGNHPEDLFASSHFYGAFTEVKGEGRACDVVFAALVGVPYEGAGAAACQGFGNQLGDCLDQDDMQLVEEQPNAPAEDTWFFRPACTRGPEGDETTIAYPGRRYVELANESFGERGFVYSICNEDWSPAVDMINQLIESRLD